MERSTGGAETRTPLEKTADEANLRWPPPGLERLQGDVWNVVRSGTLAALILVFPLLLSISLEQDFWSLGPLGSAWWVILITTGVGLGLVLEAFVTLVRLLRRAARVVERGYRWRLVAHVACDVRRDTGFLLQGARWYATLGEGQRRMVAGLRLVGAALQMISVVWLASGLAVAMLLAANGNLTATGVILFTLGPAAVCLLMALLVRTGEAHLVRRARRVWFSQPWAEEVEVSEVEQWQGQLAGHVEWRASGSSPRQARILRLTAAGVGLLGVVAVLPPFTLAPTSAIGPIMAAVAIPRFAQTQERAARAEAYRPYRLPTDASLNPVEAGRLLQTLMYVGRRSGNTPGELPPQQRYFEPWFPLGDVSGGPTGVDPRRWGEELLPRATSLPSDALDYLAGMAAHEAHGDFSRLAAAAELDAMAGRWQTPFVGVGMATLPVPRFNLLTLGANAHLGLAVHQLAIGDGPQAEQTIREVLSLGFLLADDGPTLIDNLIGFSLVNLGATALDAFYEATGRTADLAALRQARGAAERAAEVLTQGRSETLQGTLAELPAIAVSPVTLRGLRWESFALTNTIAPCLNLNRIVFGPDRNYAQWVEDVRESLVRWPSEQALFDLAVDGYFGAAPDPDSPTLLRRTLGIVIGGQGAPGSCSTVFSRLSAGR